ncbi:MAG: substrate-binding domain-containing protein [Planctomycetota bacterium]|jgi:DNA-binding LacI/PurR family transcriptional regulator
MSRFVITPRESVPRQVAGQIRLLIARQYRPGDVLPPYRKLAKDLGVGVRSVTEAMSILAGEGIVSPVRKRGTTVLRALRAGEARIRQVAVVTRGVPRRLFQGGSLGQILSGLSDRVAELEATLRLFPRRRGKPVACEEILRAGPDGAVLVGIPFNDYIAELARRDLPIVVLDHCARDIPLDYVVCDNAGAMAAVIRHLAKLGHRRAAYATFPLSRSVDSDSVELRDAFFSSAGEAGLSAHRPLYELDDDVRAAPAARELVEALRPGPTAPTAVVTDDTATADRVIACLEQAGLRVPQDVSVAAAGGARPEAPEARSITCCHMDFHAMGAKGMELLELRCHGPRTAEANIVRIGFELNVGTTAGAAKT